MADPGDLHTGGHRRQDRQHKRVQIEGEVARPGEYILPPNSTLSDLVRTAGGLTSKAFLFGAEFNRESVRLVQQQNHERVLRDLETEGSRRAGHPARGQVRHEAPTGSGCGARGGSGSSSMVCPARRSGGSDISW